MPRQSQLDQKRRELIPIVAAAFAELGFRRTTTSELAGRCRIAENVLYRLWADKKAMFIAAIEYVYEHSEKVWQKVLESDRTASQAELLLSYEAAHVDEFRHSRIVFAGLSETDDPDIRASLAKMYQRYQRFVLEQLQAHRRERKAAKRTDEPLTAWAFVGLVTVASISRELGLIGDRDRRRLVDEIGRLLMG